MYFITSCVSKVNKAIFFIDFSVPPNPPVIVNEAGREATSQLGPYPEGATIQISCEVRGGELYKFYIPYILEKLGYLKIMNQEVRVDFVEVKSDIYQGMIFKMFLILLYIRDHNYSYFQK